MAGGRSQFMAVVCRDARHHRPSFFPSQNPSDGGSMKERYGTASGFLLGYIRSCIHPACQMACVVMMRTNVRTHVAKYLTC